MDSVGIEICFINAMVKKNHSFFVRGEYHCSISLYRFTKK